MKCAACSQEFERPAPNGTCPLCGARPRIAETETRTLYVLMAAMAMSVLIYAGLVAFLEFTGFDRPEPIVGLRTMFLAIGLVMLVAMMAAERVLIKREGVSGVTSTAIIAAAMAEMPVVLGLVLYFLGNELQWFVAMLGMSAVGYIYIAFHMPQYVALLDRYKLEGK